MANSKKIVLSLDACASFGAAEMAMLGKIENALKNKFSSSAFKTSNPTAIYKGLMEYVDIVGGVSAGAMNASILQMCDKDGKHKFDIPACLKMLNDNAGNFLHKNLLGGAFYPVFNNSGVKKILDDNLGNVKFKDLGNKKLLISSYSLDDNSETIFTNLGSGSYKTPYPHYVLDTAKVKVSDAVMASSAYQVQLPAIELEYKKSDSHKKKLHTEIDGCNASSRSPILSLIDAMVSLEKVPLSKMHIVSLGLNFPKTDLRMLKNGGMVQYAYKSLPFIFNLQEAKTAKDKAFAKTIVESVGGKCDIVDMNVDSELFEELFSDSLETIENIITAANGVDVDLVVANLYDTICDTNGWAH